MAFKLVYTLDATRRENNKKVMVIKLQMKDMMIVLFEHAAISPCKTIVSNIFAGSDTSKTPAK